MRAPRKEAWLIARDNGHFMSRRGTAEGGILYKRMTTRRAMAHVTSAAQMDGRHEWIWLDGH